MTGTCSDLATPVILPRRDHGNIWRKHPHGQLQAAEPVLKMEESTIRKEQTELGRRAPRPLEVRRAGEKGMNKHWLGFSRWGCAQTDVITINRRDCKFCLERVKSSYTLPSIVPPASITSSRRRLIPRTLSVYQQGKRGRCFNKD